MSQAKRPIELRLPELESPPVPGARWARYPITLTVLWLVLLLVLFLGVAQTVRFEISPERAQTLGVPATAAADGSLSITVGQLVHSYWVNRQAAPPGPGESAP
ncbi:MAG: hypothetical protein AAF657_35140 [Acidobacteriota bacterium]